MFPKKPCDYDSDGDYDVSNFDIVLNKPSMEKFAAGQYVVIKSKKDPGGYATCQVASSVSLSLAALLRGTKNSGYIQQYPPGQFALVTYVRTLDVVTHFL